jgi:hypothetical protein
MAAHEYAFTLTPGNSSRTRSVAIACAAVAAVCVLSSTVVMRELVGTPTARAATGTAATTAAIATAPAAVATAPAATATPAPAPTTLARTWALEGRWWSGATRQIKLQAPKVRESELTFTKGYQLRLAARGATQPVTQQATQPGGPPTQVAATPTAEPARTATAARKPTAVARTDMPTVRRINATPADAQSNPFARFETGNSRALAYDEQRPSERGIAYRSAPPPRSLFGTLY